jgi:hypothetical protein
MSYDVLVSSSLAIFNGTTPGERKAVVNIDRQLVLVLATPRGTVIKALAVGDTIATTMANRRNMVGGGYWLESMATGQRSLNRVKE